MPPEPSLAPWPRTPGASQGGKGQLGAAATDTTKESERFKLPPGERLTYCPVLSLRCRARRCCLLVIVLQRELMLVLSPLKERICVFFFTQLLKALSHVLSGPFLCPLLGSSSPQPRTSSCPAAAAQPHHHPQQAQAERFPVNSNFISLKAKLTNPLRCKMPQKSSQSVWHTPCVDLQGSLHVLYMLTHGCGRRSSPPGHAFALAQPPWLRGAPAELAQAPVLPPGPAPRTHTCMDRAAFPKLVMLVPSTKPGERSMQSPRYVALRPGPV